jgi:hypothetical protein
VTAAYGECMLAAGYNLTSSPFYPEATPIAAYAMALRTKADGALGSSWTDYTFEEETPDDERSLLGSQAEIDIAVADFDCREQTDYEAIYLVEYLKWEEEFVAEHFDQLEEMKTFGETHTG